MRKKFTGGGGATTLLPLDKPRVKVILKLFVCAFVCLFIYLFVCTCVCLCVCVCLFVYVFVYFLPKLDQSVIIWQPTNVVRT